MGSIFDITALLKANTSQFTAGMKNASKRTSAFSKEMSLLKTQLLAVFSVGAVMSFAKASLKAYDEQAKGEAKLLTAMNGRADVTKEMVILSAQLQKKTLFGDEQSIDAMARMAAILGDNETAIKKLLPLVQDFATVKGMDLASAADLIAKSIASSTNALARYGIQITGTAGSTERLNSLMGQLTTHFKGQAEAAALVGLGPLEQLKNQFNDIQEIIGAELLPVVNKLATALKNIFDKGLFRKKEDYTWLDEMIVRGSGLAKWWEKMTFQKATPEEMEKFRKDWLGGGEKLTEPAQTFTSKGQMDMLMKNWFNEIDASWEKFKKDSTFYNEREKILGITGYVEMPKLEKVKDDIEGTLLSYNEIYEKFGDEKEIEWYDPMLEGIIKIRDAHREMGEQMRSSLMMGAASWDDYGKSIMSSIREIITAQSALALSKAIVSAMDTAMAAGPIGLILIPALVGAALGAANTAINQIPGFAEGGLVYGSTLARVGEYPGASTNPEVIAPLDDIKGMIGNKMQVEVIGRISGRDLAIVSRRSKAAN